MLPETVLPTPNPPAPARRARLSPRAVRALAALLGLGTASAAAQDAPYHCAGVVRSDGPAPLADAEVRFVPVADAGQLVLARWRGLLPCPTAGDPVRSSARGGFRLPTHSRRGALWVTHPAGDAPGLGALVLDPPAFVRVDCQPLGQVVFAAEVTVHVQADGGPGYGVPLGTFTTRTLRLPAGRYRLLVDAGAERLGVVACDLLPGRTREVPLPATSGRRVELTAAGGTAHLFGWPAAPLPRDGTALVLPGGDLPLRVVVEHAVPGGVVLDVHWLDGHALRATAGPPTRLLRVLDDTGAPLSGAFVASGQDGDIVDGTEATLRSIGRTGRAGQVTVPAQVSWVLVQARGFATAVVEGDAATIGLTRAVELQVAVVDRRGAHVGEAAVELRPVDQPLLTQRLVSGADGRLRVPDLGPGPVLLRLVDPRYLPGARVVQIGMESTRPAVLRALRGDTVEGVVRLAGQPVSGAHVMAETGDERGRTVFTDEKGRFVVSGLESIQYLRISARLVRDGRTYISTRRIARAGDEVEITLRSEDPLPPGGHKRQR